MNRKFNRTAFIRVFSNNVKVSFDQFNASLMNRSINLLTKNHLLTPNFCLIVCMYITVLIKSFGTL